MGPALLFCPADRPERYAKAAERADAVILDLEDAVAPDAKRDARGHVAGSRLDPVRTIVRINPLGTADADADLAALAATEYTTVMVPKAEDPVALRALAARGYAVIGLCETATGVVAAAELAAVPGVVALMWGAEDLVASMGGTASRDARGRYRAVVQHVRATVHLAAAARGVASIDTVHLDIADEAGLEEEASDAAALGFAATACIHPSQVAVVRRAYAPDPDHVAWAERVLAAARGERGVFRFDGVMVDEPVLRHARAVVARASDRAFSSSATEERG
ncbi:HpcH/HpaI aldolase/citrate lyase family protein [Microcella sp.]|uniref:HpcH/HpaI aldolase/citrate lyase family protein n=1 Tax=Microcella sp. TaxID=1913979 RepID=UPI00391D9367